MVRKIKIVQKKPAKKTWGPLQIQKLVWIAGHAITLGFGSLFCLTYTLQSLIFFKYRSWKWLFMKLNKSYSYFNGPRWYHVLLRWTPRLIYRLAIVGSFMSLGVTSYQNAHGLHPQWYEMFSAENFQYLVISLFWFFTQASVFKLLPMMLLSYMHIMNWKQEVDGIKDPDAITKKNAVVLRALAVAELLVPVSLAVNTIFMSSGASGVVLVFYLGIYWLRINFSPYMQLMMLKVLSMLDPKIPPQRAEQWGIIKKFIYSKIQDHERRKAEIEKTA